MSVFHQDVYFWRLIHLLKSFSTPVDPWARFTDILLFCQNITHCDGATLYLMDHPPTGPQLTYAIMQNQSLRLNTVFSNPSEATLPPLPLATTNENAADCLSIAAQCANAGRAICVEDIYGRPGVNISGIKAFDQQFGYRTRSVLSVPIVNSAAVNSTAATANPRVLGVIQLINPQNPLSKTVAHYSESQILVIEALASMMATLLEQ